MIKLYFYKCIYKNIHYPHNIERYLVADTHTPYIESVGYVQKYRCLVISNNVLLLDIIILLYVFIIIQ